MTKLLYLGESRDFDTHTARLLLDYLHAVSGNRALWVNGGLILVHPKGNV